MADTTRGIIGLDPTTKPPRPGEHSFAPRASMLQGAVVGMISNGKGQATRFLRALHGELARIAGVAELVLVEKSAVFAPPSPDDWALVTATASVGITAFGG